METGSAETNHVYGDSIIRKGGKGEGGFQVAWERWQSASVKFVTSKPQSQTFQKIITG